MAAMDGMRTRFDVIPFAKIPTLDLKRRWTADERR
jgi:hypothetical protein